MKLSERLRTGMTIRHYRTGLEYEVLEPYATHTETGDVLVSYARKDGLDPHIWSRPLGMFDDIVTYGGETMPRFVEVTP